jgi:hypothetical protein
LLPVPRTPTNRSRGWTKRSSGRLPPARRLPKSLRRLACDGFTCWPGVTWRTLKQVALNFTPPSSPRCGPRPAWTSWCEHRERPVCQAMCAGMAYHVRRRSGRYAVFPRHAASGTLCRRPDGMGRDLERHGLFLPFLGPLPSHRVPAPCPRRDVGPGPSPLYAGPAGEGHRVGSTFPGASMRSSWSVCTADRGWWSAHRPGKDGDDVD